ncbi:YecA family protein [Halomonas vilamensis]|uniref:YecA family protein n=1 Tax=Vreelandella vilamensis TaxID=531309 RepID=A0ABU1GZK1_9GAMM|nr:YecA family protein [Halomonas vilamensis]MDR5897488.1 YecA family protein [Halomonas vilamensis]
MSPRDNAPDATPPQPLLDDEQLDRLDDFLDSERVDDDALDLISAHGFMVALAVAPSELPATEWLAELFQGEPRYASDIERNEIISLLVALRDNAMAVLEQGGLPELPFELTLDGLPAEETPISDWCAGFMEGVFCDEDAWFADDEEAAATLLLPFMLLSGLFDDEPDMAELTSDSPRQEALVVQLPELLLDLYLHYRVPPEAPKPKPRKKTPAKGKKR